MAEAPTKKPTKPVEKKVDETIKYRCDFKTWQEYHEYKGKKG